MPCEGVHRSTYPDSRDQHPVNPGTPHRSGERLPHREETPPTRQCSAPVLWIRCFEGSGRGRIIANERAARRVHALHTTNPRIVFTLRKCHAAGERLFAVAWRAGQRPVGRAHLPVPAVSDPPERVHMGSQSPPTHVTRSRRANVARDGQMCPSYGGRRSPLRVFLRHEMHSSLVTEGTQDQSSRHVTPRSKQSSSFPIRT